jgi:hypothetical protein
VTSVGGDGMIYWRDRALTLVAQPLDTTAISQQGAQNVSCLQKPQVQSIDVFGNEVCNRTRI